jgi:uncharacterized protein YcfL
VLGRTRISDSVVRYAAFLFVSFLKKTIYFNLKVTKMKKLFIPLSLIATALLIFVACRKNEKILDVEKEFSVESVKEWYNTTFIKTPEYIQGTTGSGVRKAPSWTMGEVYNIGDVKIAEFPLLIDKRKVYISEQLTEANAKRVVEHTRYKVIFVQSPNKKIQVRIVQFTPTFDYLQSKNFNLSKLSFKDYQKDFKGDIMLFDFDNNFKNGYHFSNEKTKIIKLKTKFPNQNTSNRDLICTNGVTITPGCHYIVHTVYTFSCSNGWSAGEGFNPDYCTIGQVLSADCELQYCDPPNDNGDDQDLINCINSGSTQVQCLCSLYSLGCDGDDGEEVDEESQNIFNTYSASQEGTSVSSSSEDLGNDNIRLTISWNVFESLNWQIETSYRFTWNKSFGNKTCFDFVKYPSFYSGTPFPVEITWTEIINDIPWATENNTPHPTVWHQVKGTYEARMVTWAGKIIRKTFSPGLVKRGYPL